MLTFQPVQRLSVISSNIDLRFSGKIYYGTVPLCCRENKSGNINTGKIFDQRYNYRRFAGWQRGIARICGRNSVVECQLPKLDVEGSNPFARFLMRLASHLCLRNPPAFLPAAPPRLLVEDKSGGRRGGRRKQEGGCRQCNSLLLHPAW